jgi:hypothetical protein
MIPGLSALGIDLNREHPPSFFRDLHRGRLKDRFLIGWLNGPVSRLIEEQGFMAAMLTLIEKAGKNVHPGRADPRVHRRTLGGDGAR